MAETAFQVNAFQNNAFQIFSGSGGSTGTGTAGGPGRGRRKKVARRREEALPPPVPLFTELYHELVEAPVAPFEQPSLPDYQLPDMGGIDFGVSDLLDQRDALDALRAVEEGQAREAAHQEADDIDAMDGLKAVEDALAAEQRQNAQDEIDAADAMAVLIGLTTTRMQ